MKAMRANDPLFGEGEVRADGCTLHDLYLFKVKAPSQSRYPWDYHQRLSTIPASVAFKPVNEGSCPLAVSQ
jgi:branched-chain amino acid transport system substrate-binding protein